LVGGRRRLRTGRERLQGAGLLLLLLLLLMGAAQVLSYGWPGVQVLHALEVGGQPHLRLTTNVVQPPL
jgi:hypothetical protein